MSVVITVKEIVLIIGGCRSGKSSYALELAAQVPEKNNIFIATLVPGDDEMQARVQRHQNERDQHWKTVEAPIRLPEAVNKHGRKGNVVVVDCLTLWLSNLLLENDDPQSIEEQIHELIQAFETVQCPIFLVSNEVGTGIVPENRLARLFRDLAGFANQKVAACADSVVWMVAGIPVLVKNSGPED
jgi:adenosylcobinamide kinase/adenosylcobinamide-phosphate guanylyltransferase